MNLAMEQDGLPQPSCDEVASLVRQVLRIMEVERDGHRRLAVDVARLEEDWAAVQRTASSLGWYVRAQEAPPPTLPRGAAATRNWLQQRLADGARNRAWIERLPALLALFRPVEPITVSGRVQALPPADKAALEALQADVRRAIVCQDVPAMDRLLPQLQQTLTQNGQRRQDLLRIMSSRAAAVAAAVDSFGTPDTHAVPAVACWLERARQEASALSRSIEAWDVRSARAAEKLLNSLADEVGGLRGQLEASRTRAENSAEDFEKKRRAGASQLAELRQRVEESTGVWSAVVSGWAVIAVLGGVGTVVGLTIAAVVLGTGNADDVYGAIGLSSPLVLGSTGAIVGLIIGVVRSKRRRSSAIAEALRIERDVEKSATESALEREKAAYLKIVLGWFALSI